MRFAICDLRLPIFFLLLAVLFLLLGGCVTAPERKVQSAERKAHSDAPIRVKTDDIKTIVAFMTTHDSSLEEKYQMYAYEDDYSVRIVMEASENLAEHNNFPWKYAVHFVILIRHKLTGQSVFNLIVKEYQEYTTPGRGFIQYVFTDKGLDGSIDSTSRRYQILNDKNYFLLPNWPEGFVSRNWHLPPPKVFQKQLDKTIGFWLRLIVQVESGPEEEKTRL